MSPSDDKRTPDQKIFDDIFRKGFLHDKNEADKSISDRAIALLGTKSRAVYLALIIPYVIFTGVTLWVVYKFFWAYLSAADIRTLVFWGVSAVLCGLVIVGTELWFWMEMNRNSLLREVKRLELQVSLLREENKPDA
ncbi:DUF6768 family protein [Paremcibacter congregatus]|uniref:DUF6768 family protein n=1 Tax=Paremcibacter congregatus TaxID=2043170 RepID=UPI0030ECBCEC|tara:strand:+ start:421 stop:831 length:411 start_codon:yes stop_codon:yes gene_type:complete